MFIFIFRRRWVFIKHTYCIFCRRMGNTIRLDPIYVFSRRWIYVYLYDKEFCLVCFLLLSGVQIHLSVQTNLFWILFSIKYYSAWSWCWWCLSRDNHSSDAKFSNQVLIRHTIRMFWIILKSVLGFLLFLTKPYIYIFDSFIHQVVFEVCCFCRRGVVSGIIVGGFSISAVIWTLAFHYSTVQTFFLGIGISAQAVGLLALLFIDLKVCGFGVGWVSKIDLLSTSTSVLRN